MNSNGLCNRSTYEARMFLHSNSTLSLLDLSENMIGSLGIAFLLKAMQHNHRLRVQQYKLYHQVLQGCYWPDQDENLQCKCMSRVICARHFSARQCARSYYVQRPVALHFAQTRHAPHQLRHDRPVETTLSCVQSNVCSGTASASFVRGMERTF